MRFMRRGERRRERERNCPKLTHLGLVALRVHGIQVDDVGVPVPRDEEHVVRDVLQPGGEVVPVHEGVDVESLVPRVGPDLPDAVLVLVQRRGQLLVALDVLQLVPEAVEGKVVPGGADGQAREALSYLLLIRRKKIVTL